MPIETDNVRPTDDITNYLSVILKRARNGEPMAMRFLEAYQAREVKRREELRKAQAALVSALSALNGQIETSILNENAEVYA